MKKIIKKIEDSIMITNRVENLIILILVIFQKKINLLLIYLEKKKKTFSILVKFSILFFIFFTICNLPFRFFNNFGYIYYLIIICSISVILINYFRE